MCQSIYHTVRRNSKTILASLTGNILSGSAFWLTGHSHAFGEEINLFGSAWVDGGAYLDLGVSKVFSEGDECPFQNDYHSDSRIVLDFDTCANGGLNVKCFEFCRWPHYFKTLDSFFPQPVFFIS